MAKMKFKILLYYKYVKLRNPELVRASQRELCEKLDLKGRIIVSTEGINGTVAGTCDNVDSYIVETEKRKAFSGIEWKISWSDEQVFPKLKVKVRDEIVTLGLKSIGSDVPIAKKADYIEPEELMDLYEKNHDFVIVDARNNYEAAVGKFKDAIVAPIDNFRDFPEFVEKLEGFKDKEVVTYCTGGVRCEKASALLRQSGFKNVRQLHGGIHNYSDKVGGKHFEGEMFVFDKRLQVPVNMVDPKVISKCVFCEKPISRYIDCAVLTCHALFICCEDCQQQNKSTCSAICLDELESQTGGIENKITQPTFGELAL